MIQQNKSADNLLLTREYFLTFEATPVAPHLCSMIFIDYLYFCFFLLHYIFFLFHNLPCDIYLNGINVLSQVHFVAHHCVGSQQAEEQRRVMNFCITLQYLLLPTALLLAAKTVWGAIITLHIKSDYLTISWKTKISTLIKAKEFPFSKGFIK